MEELKSCPFCGNKAKLDVESDIRMDRPRSARIVCRTCYFAISSVSKEEAMVTWNKRAEATWEFPDENKLHLHKAILVIIKTDIYMFPKYGRMTQTDEFTEFHTGKSWNINELVKVFTIPSWKSNVSEV